jgi:hypothetical protein
MSICLNIPSLDAFDAICGHACESVYIAYGFGHVKSRKCIMFSACKICLQQTLEATYSAEQVESTTVVRFNEPHNKGIPLIITKNPVTLCFNSPTAKEASEYATRVNLVFVIGKL